LDLEIEGLECFVAFGFVQLPRVEFGGRMFGIGDGYGEALA